MLRWRVVPIWLATGALLFAYWWAEGRPISSDDASAAARACVSYAPFRAGQSPYDETLVIAPAAIEEDLRLIAGRFACVRTYTVRHGLVVVPEIARQLGLQVALGAWIGREAKDNDREIAAAVDLANRYPDVIRTVVVGNEVLLRRELPVARLASLIRRVRDGTRVPVTYADVWDFWLQNPELGRDVDSIMIHLLPYWEDEPIPVEAAARHAAGIYGRVKAAFPDRPVVVGEAGWPSAGRMREGALPSLVNQARFAREILAWADREGIDVTLFEAFDQPWKRLQEGTVGGHWGHFSVDRKPKFGLAGPIGGDLDWLRHFLAAFAVATVALFGLSLKVGRQTIGGSIALSAAVGFAGAVIVLEARRLAEASATLIDWTVGGGRLGLGTLAALITAAVAFRTSAAPGERLVLPAGAAVGELMRRQGPPRLVLAHGLGLARGVVLLGAAVTTLTLLFDPRYRDFPVTGYLLPALAFAWLAWRDRKSAIGDDAREEIFLARLVAVGGIAVAVLEGPLNHQAWAWAALGLMIGAGAGPKALPSLRRTGAA